MMEQYKYEPLYGLQKPFDNGPADSTAYGLFRDGDEYIYYKIDKTSVYRGARKTSPFRARMNSATAKPF